MKPWFVHIFTTFPLPCFSCCDALISDIAQEVSHSVLRSRLPPSNNQILGRAGKAGNFNSGLLEYQRKEEDRLSC